MYGGSETQSPRATNRANSDRSDRQLARRGDRAVGSISPLLAPCSPLPQAMQDALEANGLTASGNVQANCSAHVSASLPLLTVREADLEALRAIVPLDLWSRILAHLDEPGLVAAERVSRGMYALAVQVEREQVDPRIEPWRSQTMHCESVLAELAIDRRPVQARARREAAASAETVKNERIAKYEKTLSDLASCTRCLSLKVHADRATAVWHALSQTCGWQLAVMCVTEEVKDAFLAPLEGALRIRGVKRELHLRLSSTACVRNYNPASPALLLTRLQLLSDLQGDLAPVCTLLGRANAIQELSLVVNSRDARPLVKALQEGSQALRVLHLYQFASPELLAILASKPALNELLLGECSLRAGGLTLAAVLQGAPALQTLHLGAVKFEAGSTAQCMQALRASGLQTVKFMRCIWFAAERHLGNSVHFSGEIPGLHQELYEGLAHAPKLRELWLATLTERGDLFILNAFAHNPHARTVRIVDQSEESAQSAINAVRDVRSGLKLEPLTFV